MRRLLILMFSVLAVCNLSVAQSKVSEYYQPVDIDSVLSAPISLPENTPYIIQDVEFSIFSNKITDVGKTAPGVRDRVLQFNQRYQDQDWEYKASAYFKVADSTLILTLSKSVQFDKLVKAAENKNNVLLTIKAKMLTGKFKRYNVTRDLLVQHIQIGQK